MSFRQDKTRIWWQQDWLHTHSFPTTLMLWWSACIHSGLSFCCDTKRYKVAADEFLNRNWCFMLKRKRTLFVICGARENISLSSLDEKRSCICTYFRHGLLLLLLLLVNDSFERISVYLVILLVFLIVLWSDNKYVKEHLSDNSLPLDKR